MLKIIKTELIEEYIREHNLSKKKFCELCNIGLGTLNKIMGDETNFRINALFKIARIRKINVCQLFNEALLRRKKST